MVYYRSSLRNGYRSTEWARGDLGPIYTLTACGWSDRVRVDRVNGSDFRGGGGVNRRRGGRLFWPPPPSSLTPLFSDRKFGPHQYIIFSLICWYLYCRAGIFLENYLADFSKLHFANFLYLIWGNLFWRIFELPLFVTNTWVPYFYWRMCLYQSLLFIG